MSEARVLIVDDEPDIRELLEITLGRMKLETVAAPDLKKAHALLESEKFDLCLTDMKLPDGNGITLVETISENHPNLPVAVITAFGSMDIAISALKAGAFDFISKPIDLEMLRSIVQSALKLQQSSAKSSSAPAEASENTLLGESSAVDQLRQQIKKLARSQAPIFIHGESGSGKELAARSIHKQSGRSEAAFIAVNCGAIPRELMESEFFGHKKGSFTGATTDKDGLFQVASGGTLFLDEVADLPTDMQVKLLRAIQEKAVRPIGADSETPVDVRILSASHKDLEREVADKNFRQDLFFRINVIRLDIPSLRDRREDIPDLVVNIMHKLNANTGQDITLDAGALKALGEYPFPGNVRELENILERAFTLVDGNVITQEGLNLPDSSRNAGDTTPDTAITQPTPVMTPSEQGGFSPQVTPPAFTNLEEFLESIERQIIEQALEECRWNKTAAAKKLGVTFRQLRYKLKKLKLN
jgi:two-component system response regulator PilR (NtrC family)